MYHITVGFKNINPSLVGKTLYSGGSFLSLNPFRLFDNGAPAMSEKKDHITFLAMLIGWIVRLRIQKKLEHVGC